MYKANSPEHRRISFRKKGVNVRGQRYAAVLAAEHAAWVRLTAQMRQIQAFDADKTEIYLHSTNQKKKSGAQKITEDRLSHTNVHTVIVPGYVEPEWPNASEVARNKAEAAHLLTNHPSLGMDTTFGRRAENQLWVAEQRLDRNGPLSEEQQAMHIMQMAQWLVYTDKIRLQWNAAHALVNGAEHIASVLVCVEAAPFSPQAFLTFIQEALETGMFYRSNSHGMLIEWLRKLDEVQRIAFIPDDALRNTHVYSIGDWWQEPTSHLLKLAEDTIQTTTPLPLLGMR